MRAIVQRVTRASVVDRADGKRSEIGVGLLLLVGVHKSDSEVQAKKLAEKISNLRIFNDADGKMNLSLAEVPNSDVLAVSNFTVYGDTKKNRRPSFTDSAPFETGKSLFDQFVVALRGYGYQVPTGVFGADMAVELENDGPVTVIVDVDA